MTSDLRDSLQATLGTAYTVERELGGGGMSRVFVARDVTLGREIVVKVLPAEAADVPIERFKREIAVAAKLQHPHIVPLLSAGELNGLPYYTMPYVEGESLRARLVRGEMLSISEAGSILKDLARALAYAHDHGVVHRDIKPDNVLLTGGSAVVTDFGIAKALAEARTIDLGQPAPPGTLTQIGTSIGTPAYMSPEQIAGDPSVDLRADIYAFGCVAYEMLAGARPFAGPTSHQFFAAHLSEKPRPLAERRPDCPAILAQLVMRCLEKDPSRRPQAAAELLQSLDGIATPTARTKWRTSRRVRGSLATAVMFVAVTALFGGYRFWRARTDATVVKRVAVIPFANVGGDSAQLYFADGVSDELTTALGRVPGVHVASRNLAYRYRGQRDADARAVGRELDVEYVVQGTLRRAGGRLRISAQLTSARDGAEIWADEIERDAADVFSAQNDITTSIIANLRPHLASGAKPIASQATAQGTSNADAYDLYLRGRFLLERRGSGVQLAIENFEQAIARDSGFGRAYGALSLALELMPYFGNVPAPDVRARAWGAAHRALSIDSTLAQAHAALGMLYEHEYQWKPALDELRRAVEYGPDDASVRLQYGRALLYVGDYYAAKAQFQQTRKMDPYSAVVSAWVATIFALGGQTDSAMAELRRALQIDSTSLVALWSGARLMLEAGHPDEARALARRLPRSNSFAATYVGIVLARTGDRAGAIRFLRDLEARQPRPWFGELTIALTALGLGDTSRALAALERATDAREIWPSSLSLFEPVYDPLRASPRFAALVRRVGLDVNIFTSPNGGRPH